MLKRILLAVGGLIAGMMVCSADDERVCGQDRNLSARLAACTKLIDDVNKSQALKAVAHRIRGYIRAKAGANKEALRDLNIALRMKPDDAVAFANRAHVHLAIGETKKAIDDLTSALRLKPRSQDFLVSRGYAYVVGNNFDAAISDFNLVLGLNPNNVVALNNRGLAYRKKGDEGRAIEDYSAALNKNPIYALAYANRGYAHEALGEKKKAIADFTRAVTLDPTLTGAKAGLDRLGHSQYGVDLKKSMEQGKKLVEKNCAWCHSIEQKGKSPNPKAPPFRTIQQRHPLLALREPFTKGIAAPHDVMPKYALSPSQIDKIVAYVHSLTPTP
ncbi:MAG: tetratricopeptide repeat protein [Hyphomicrobiaceae bacterium]